ncbi:hypothetical protein P7C70_g4147, partial [Phenoliferia sp. Uapishka_3]
MADESWSTQLSSSPYVHPTLANATLKMHISLASLALAAFATQSLALDLDGLTSDIGGAIGTAITGVLLASPCGGVGVDDQFRVAGAESIFTIVTSGAGGALTTVTSAVDGAFTTATSDAAGAFSTATSDAAGAFTTATAGESNSRGGNAPKRLTVLFDSGAASVFTVVTSGANGVLTTITSDAVGAFSTATAVADPDAEDDGAADNALELEADADGVGALEEELFADEDGLLLDDEGALLVVAEVDFIDELTWVELRLDAFDELDDRELEDDFGGAEDDADELESFEELKEATARIED